MADLHKAEAAFRAGLAAVNPHTLANEEAELYERGVALLAALDAARGEAVATVRTDYSSGTAAHAFGFTRIEFHGDIPPRDGTKLFAAPPAALADELSIAAHGKRMYDRGFADALSTAQAQQPAAAVPDGYALVPRKLTPKMMTAAKLAHLDYKDHAVYRQIEAIWDAAIAAERKGEP